MWPGKPCQVTVVFRARLLRQNSGLERWQRKSTGTPGRPGESNGLTLSKSLKLCTSVTLFEILKWIAAKDAELIPVEKINTKIIFQEKKSLVFFFVYQNLVSISRWSGSKLVSIKLLLLLLLGNLYRTIVLIETSTVLYSIIMEKTHWINMFLNVVWKMIKTTIV